MAANAELARIFTEMSKALELQGANPFRVGAYSRAARGIADLTFDVTTIAHDHKKLTAIDGIGDGTAKKITEYINTGRVEDHDNLLKEVPAGLFDVMKIPGLGPKTVKLMWEQTGVTDMATLRSALDAGELEGLPRLGKKSVENIRAAIAFADRASKRTLLGRALPIAEEIIAALREVQGVKKIAFAGSLRRGKETIGDIDILAAAKDPRPITEAFTGLDGVTQVLAAGGSKASIRYDDRIQVDLRIVPEASFGAAMMYFTGSKEHNIALRERAIKRGLRLNEYGLFPESEEDTDRPPQDRGVRPVASKTEEDVYSALDLSYLPPEMREEWAPVGHEPPDGLITLDDIRAELHAHTKASDGRLTIEELAREAKSRGFHTVAVTDHSKSSVQANGLSPEDLVAFIDEIRAAEVKGIGILAGSEVDILTDGKLDYEDDLLAALDIVVASPHAALTQEERTATKRIRAAIEHPLVHIIGHPTGRYIGRRSGLPIAIEELARAAAEHDVALEINANSMRLDLRDTHVRAAIDAGALIAINTDAHSVGDFDQLRYGILTARRAGLPAERCINTWSASKLRKWLQEKRR